MTIRQIKDAGEKERMKERKKERKKERRKEKLTGV